MYLLSWFQVSSTLVLADYCSYFITVVVVALLTDQQPRNDLSSQNASNESCVPCDPGTHADQGII